MVPAYNGCASGSLISTTASLPCPSAQELVWAQGHEITSGWHLEGGLQVPMDCLQLHWNKLSGKGHSWSVLQQCFQPQEGD